MIPSSSGTRTRASDWTPAISSIITAICAGWYSGSEEADGGVRPETRDVRIDLQALPVLAYESGDSQEPIQPGDVRVVFQQRTFECQVDRPRQTRVEVGKSRSG